MPTPSQVREGRYRSAASLGRERRARARGVEWAMSATGTLAVFLDGYEESLERQFSEAGLLPHLTRLRRQSVVSP